MAKGGFNRWLYRGGRPNWIARMVNRATAAVFSTGVATNYLATLEVTGRKSGRTLSLPVVIAIVDGQRYLVSMLGEKVSWVQNVRAAGGRAVLRSGGRERVQLVEVHASQRAPILKACLQRAPGARHTSRRIKMRLLRRLKRLRRHFPSSALLPPPFRERYISRCVVPSPAAQRRKPDVSRCKSPVACLDSPGRQ